MDVIDSMGEGRSFNGTINGGRNLFLISLFILIILLSPVVSKAASDPHIIITQVESKLPDVTLFVRLENIEMNSLSLKKNLSININNSPTKITSIQSFATGNGDTDNTAYLFLIDPSMVTQDQDQLSELLSLLERFLGSVGPKDQTAIFRVGRKLETLKDFAVNDSLENVLKTVKTNLSSSSGPGTYLYSGIREAYDSARIGIDLPTRRVIVLITDGGVKGDSLSCEDLKNYMYVDRLPVYTLILNQQTSIDEEFKNAAEQIAQTTGGQSFISSSGGMLFALLKTSLEEGKVIKLRCDRYKGFNLQADVNIVLADKQGEIKQTAKFTATPVPKDEASGDSEKYLRTSYYGVAVILFFMVIALVMVLAFMWMLIRNKERNHESSETQISKTDIDSPNSLESNQESTQEVQDDQVPQTTEVSVALEIPATVETSQTDSALESQHK